MNTKTSSLLDQVHATQSNVNFSGNVAISMKKILSAKKANTSLQRFTVGKNATTSHKKQKSFHIVMLGSFDSQRSAERIAPLQILNPQEVQDNETLALKQVVFSETDRVSERLSKMRGHAELVRKQSQETQQECNAVLDSYNTAICALDRACGIKLKVARDELHSEQSKAQEIEDQIEAVRNNAGKPLGFFQIPSMLSRKPRECPRRKQESLELSYGRIASQRPATSSQRMTAFGKRLGTSSSVRSTSNAVMSKKREHQSINRSQRLALPEINIETLESESASKYDSKPKAKNTDLKVFFANRNSRNGKKISLSSAKSSSHSVCSTSASVHSAIQL